MRMADKTYRRASERRLREVREATEVLATIDSDWLWEMQRRREQLAAGEPLASPSLNDGSRSTDDTSTTERQAISIGKGCRQPLFIKLDGLKPRYCSRCGFQATDHAPDPIGATVEEIFDLLDKATQALRTIPGRSRVVLMAADDHRGRSSSLGDCGSCGKSVTGMGHDRLISGYGPCCYQKWRQFVAQQDYDGLDMSHVMFREQEKVKRATAKALEDEIDIHAAQGA